MRFSKSLQGSKSAITMEEMKKRKKFKISCQESLRKLKFCPICYKTSKIRY